MNLERKNIQDSVVAGDMSSWYQQECIKSQRIKEEEIKKQGIWAGPAEGEGEAQPQLTISQAKLENRVFNSNFSLMLWGKPTCIDYKFLKETFKNPKPSLHVLLKT